MLWPSTDDGGVNDYRNRAGVHDRLHTGGKWVEAGGDQTIAVHVAATQESTKSTGTYQCSTAVWNQ